MDHRELSEVADLLARIARLEADLHQCLEFFTERADIVDGDDGLPAPNKEMRLAAMCDETLNGRPL